jgi:hypothetical protein
VVDKLTKDAHFVLVKTTHKVANIAKIYMQEISKLHGVPKVIVFYRDPKLTSNFWKRLFKGFGTSYHLDSYEKTKRNNMIIEDMLRIHVMDQPSKWEDYLHLVEFDYNNGYQASLKMSLCYTLYGKKCNMPVS